MSRYIDADKALEDADTIDPKYKTLIEQVKRIINAQPSADVVEVRRGRWTGKTYKCSLCGKWIDPLQGDADMNYCPNCGARMDGEEE